MSIRYEQLPASVRAQVDRAIGTDIRAPRRGKGGGSTGGDAAWRCMRSDCGDVMTSWAAVERHTLTPGHGMVEQILDLPSVNAVASPDQPKEDIPMTTDLGEYDGKPVRKMALEVRNTSGGLNAAIKVEGQPIHSGERRFVVYEVLFDKFRFDPMDDGEAWCLVPIGTAGTAAFLDEATVKDAIEKSRAAQIALDDEKKGRLPIEPVDRIEEHNRGMHKRPRKDCEECQAAVAEKQRLRDEAKPPKAKPATKRRGRGKLTAV